MNGKLRTHERAEATIDAKFQNILFQLRKMISLFIVGFALFQNLLRAVAPTKPATFAAGRNDKNFAFNGSFLVFDKLMSYITHFRNRPAFNTQNYSSSVFIVRIAMPKIFQPSN